MKPNPTSTFLHLLLPLALASAAPEVSAQVPTQALTLERALSRFGQNSPELEMARDQMLSASELARQGKAVPNLTTLLTHEDLGQYSETYLLLEQRLEFIWEQGRKGDRAEAWTAAAAARFEADSTRLATEMKRAFVTAWDRRQAVGVLDRARDLVGELVVSAEARVGEGDLAGYDLRRLRWEHARMARRLALAEVELEDAERALGTYVSGAGEPLRVSGIELGPDGPPAVEEDLATGGALARRPELRGASARVAALDLDASLAGGSWLSGTTATGGFKDQSDGLNGWFLGLSVPLPLTDRRGAAKEAAAAAANRERARVDLLTRVIQRQASRAGSRLDSANRQRALLGPDAVTAAEELLNIARMSYDEGEIDIVALLDATRAFVEARLLDSRVRADAWIAYFELEAAVGGFPDAANTGSDR